MTTVSLKLLIDNQNRRVLFAESGKDFVDFLFSFLTMPIGTVVNLLTTPAMVGSLGILYEGVDHLNQTYMQPSQTKDPLLCPKTSYLNPKTPLLQLDSDEYSQFTVYSCTKHWGMYASVSGRAICPTCKGRMVAMMTYVAPPRGTGVEDCTITAATGYVKEAVTYMITDDLEVRPMSATLAITLYKLFNIKEIGAVEEKVVDMGMDKALELLKASLQSKSVLSDVFLGRTEEIFERK